jgi:hypothetical protein
MSGPGSPGRLTNDRGRCDVLGSIPHGLRRRPRDDSDDLADQPFGQGEDRASSALVGLAVSIPVI